jgi:hypothetical protein
MSDNNAPVSRAYFDARLESIEVKLALLKQALERDNDRQDEAIERIGDRATHIAETQRLKERIKNLERQVDWGRDLLSDLRYKVKVTWGIGGFLIAIFMSVITAIIKGWIGV